MAYLKPKRPELPYQPRLARIDGGDVFILHDYEQLVRALIDIISARDPWPEEVHPLQSANTVMREDYTRNRLASKNGGGAEPSLVWGHDLAFVAPNRAQTSSSAWRLLDRHRCCATHPG
ncbi:uncharacterized protein CANTADRAFT_218586 [Suhomyces tanzawaensis NRRL Y-17324]|uniref:Uncharacterized protein n=1 Tax=Suhomyces tanzawaensis NRRL Y-17324 TaxID=984487 RepID=A0A1E4SKC7_9ASCO|nr:uncharacterized protein CANTADRAFT_218586 [Suhomyces tanzawaensis NRRL Y-17324]ODV79887.1 hypothetical protein CANTADRAFT_218586 [Suhomyces tanzawaensis NRRL Y-17324]